MAFLLISSFTAALGVYAGAVIGRTADLVTKTFDQSLMSINYARAASSDFAGMEAALARGYLTTDPEKKIQLDQRLVDLRKSLDEDLAIAAERSQSADATKAARSVRHAVEAWDLARRRLPAIRIAGAELRTLDGYAQVVSQQIDLLINYTAGDGFTYRQSALDAVSRNTRLALGASVIVLVLSGLVTWLLARHIATPLSAASAAAESIAAGRLEEDIPSGSHDELGSLLQSMRIMRNNIKSMMEREVSLRRSAQSRLVDALESSPEGIVMVDAEGRVELTNSQATNFFGPLDQRQLEASASGRLLESKNSHLSPVNLLATDQAVASEIQLPDGRHLRVNVSATQDGGCIGLFSDISLLKEQEAKLKSANELLDAALDNMSQGLCLYDADRKLKVVNRRYCEIFSVSEDELLPGITFEQVVDLSVRAGNHPGQSASDIIAEERGSAAAGASDSRFQELSGDRVVAITRTSLPGGGWVATYEDVTERRRAEAQIVFMARHDSLTQLCNRVLFGERVSSAIAAIDQSGNSFSVLCLDLDHFKEVNDTLGHPFGDQLLKAVAARLRTCVRACDTVARLGGDEFAILLFGLDREESEAIARRVVTALGSPYEIDGETVSITASIGIARAPHDGTSYDVLLKNADVALYLAKREGRATWRFFESHMEIELLRRRAIEADLREAIADEEFEVFYQPIFDMSENRVVCFEALVRWRHEERGLVSPAEFIPIAEELGLIIDLGAWVLRKACSQALSWPEHTRVAVNVSAMQFKNSNFLDVVKDALATSTLNPRRLELEVTESVLLSNTESNLATLQALRKLGISISMDDFGTGYSSLSYLGSFPFDKLKIDQSFVRTLSVNDGHRAIIRAVVALGSSLGIRTVAEGVETAEQLTWLCEIGCDQVQGYYLSKPVPHGEVGSLLDAQPLSSRQSSMREAASPIFKFATARE